MEKPYKVVSYFVTYSVIHSTAGFFVLFIVHLYAVA